MRSDVRQRACRVFAHQMERSALKIIGLMSGTSVDGIDVALCEIEGAPPALTARILKAGSVPYDPAFREQVLAACASGTVDVLCRLNVALAERFVAAIRAVVGPCDGVDLIGSHGQTFWHDVTPDGFVTSTLQLGSAAVLVEQTGITTIHNFRERDVAAGGQGAPLTAYVDWLVLRDPSRWRAVQNIGGMGNVTFLPPLNQDGALVAFDTGPGNALIDAAASLITHGTQAYDRDGLLAASGQVNAAWLADLLRHPFFRQPPPRTTGRETFGVALAHGLVEQGRALGIDDAGIMATLTALTAHSIAHAYRDYAPHPPHQVILGGGGVHNRTLVTMLRDLLAPAQVITHEAVGEGDTHAPAGDASDGHGFSDFKEALVFAVLAYETWHNRPGVLTGQTGARHPAVLGQITPGANFASLIERTWRRVDAP